MPSFETRVTLIKNNDAGLSVKNLRVRFTCDKTQVLNMIRPGGEVKCYKSSLTRATVGQPAIIRKKVGETHDFLLN